MRPVSILFAKAPIPGQVKTRLSPPLSSAEAASLHDAFTRDMVQKLLTWGATDVELHTDVIWDAWIGLGVSTELQKGADLGQKMRNAASAAGRDALIVGSDAPTLPVEFLARLILRKGDVILGPTEDGGYYAILMRRTDPHMFDGVAWSSEHALAQTIEAVERAGLSVELGDAWYDIDHPADLVRLRAEPVTKVPAATRQWLAAHPVKRGAARHAEPGE